MCGLFGLQFTHNDKIKDDKIRSSLKLLQHRGPDGSGFEKLGNVVLAHSRLSFLDLHSRSNQPFWDSKKEYCLVYNGEIYNYKTIKNDLIKLGVQFSTTSDTEVLLYALIHYGTDILSRLEGMFAFAFYDIKKQTILICRDRFGIKPLFLCKTPDGILFSSEVNAFSPWYDLAADDNSVISFLGGFDGNTQGKSFFKNIYQLEAGKYAVIKNQKIESESYFFRLTDFVDDNYHAELTQTSTSTLIDKMDELLLSSVEKHMIADVPVGALCSGGVDSSLIMAMATRYHDDLQIFHANVVGPHSEVDAASALAKHLKLDLKIVEAHDDDFITMIPDVIQHYGYPFSYHPNSVPFMKVTQLVKQHNIKAILTGEGADESLLGYSHIPTENIFNGINTGILKIRNLIKNIPLFGDKLLVNDFKNCSTVALLTGAYETESEKRALSNLDTNVNRNTLKTVAYLGYHLRTLLHRNDTMGMASSIEARFPFLDHDVMKFAVNLPYNLKIRKTLSAYNELKHPFIKSKWILRKIADRYLPAELSQRRKRGFPTNAFERMQINTNLFHNSCINEIFSVTNNQLDLILDSSNRDFKQRLLQLLVWNNLLLRNQSNESITLELQKHLSIKPL